MKCENNKYHNPRVFPYYKIQIYNEKFAAWVDIQKAFYDFSHLISYAREKRLDRQKARIIIVEGEGNRREFGALRLG